MKMKSIRPITLFGAVIILALTVIATPSFIHYQGILTDDLGAPVTPGDYDMEFNIYASEDGGPALWTEVRTIAGGNPVEVKNGGKFHVKLGEYVELNENVFSESSRWLGITVGNDDEMDPRTAIGSVPYAFMAGTVPDKTLGHEKIKNKAIADSLLDDKAVGPDKVKLKAIADSLLDDKAVGSDKVKLKAIADSLLDDKAVGPDKVKLKAIADSLLDDKAVGPDKIKLNAIADSLIENAAITTDHIRDYTILFDDFADNEADDGDVIKWIDNLWQPSPDLQGGNESGWIDDGTKVRLLTSTDYVGIGTDDPQAPLEVTGSEASHSAVGIFRMGSANNNPALNGNHLGDGPGVLGKNSPTGNYGILGDDSVGVLGYVSGPDAPTEPNYGIYGKYYNTGSPNKITYGYLGGWNTAVYGNCEEDGRWAGYFDGNVYISQNVGIGTTEPNGPLQIEDMGIDIDIFNLNSQVAPFIIKDDDDNAAMLFDVDQIEHAGNGPYNTLYLNKVSSSDVILALGGGRVGIGSPLSSAKLNVGGSIDAAGAIQSANILTINGAGSEISSINGAISFSDDNLNTTGTITSGNITIDGTSSKITSTSGTIDFDDENIVTTGSVGLGIAVPEAKLHINSSGIIPLRVIGSDQTFLQRSGTDMTNLLSLYNPDQTNDNGVSLNFRGNSGATESEIFASMDVTYTSHVPPSAEFCFKTRDGGDWGERLRIASNGDVGINTSTPAGALHVVSDNGGVLFERSGTGITSALSLYNPDITDGNGVGLTFRGYYGVSSYAYAAIQAEFTTHSPANTDMVFYTRDDSNWDERLRIKSNGYVGIGIDTPTEALHVVGNICYTGSSTTCSDRRYKTNLKTTTGALDKLMHLSPVDFDWRRDEYPEYKFSDLRQTGLIAQDVGKILPHIVSQGSDGYQSIDYSKLTPLLVAALQEQQQTIEELQAQVEMLLKLYEESGNTGQNGLNR